VRRSQSSVASNVPQLNAEDPYDETPEDSCRRTRERSCSRMDNCGGPGVSGYLRPVAVLRGMGRLSEAEVEWLLSRECRRAPVRRFAVSSSVEPGSIRTMVNPLSPRSRQA
jgi:hypothetical protein